MESRWLDAVEVAIGAISSSAAAVGINNPNVEGLFARVVLALEMPALLTSLIPAQRRTALRLKGVRNRPPMAGRVVHSLPLEPGQQPLERRRS